LGRLPSRVAALPLTCRSNFTEKVALGRVAGVCRRRAKF
jgi:hypothetical protein